MLAFTEEDFLIVRTNKKFYRSVRLIKNARHQTITVPIIYVLKYSKFFYVCKLNILFCKFFKGNIVGT